MTCINQTQHSPSHCLLTPLMSPKDRNCQMNDAYLGDAKELELDILLYSIIFT